jgi:hypothetical protein
MKNFKEFVQEDSQNKQRKQAEKEEDIKAIISKKEPLMFHQTPAPEEKEETQ